MTDKDLALALRLADAAGAAIRPLFRGQWSQERKSDRSFVTEADRAAEAAMRRLIEAEFSADGIIGEEYGTRNEGAGRQWVLDPAISQINDFGTVTVTMTPEKVGRSITAVRFDWKWKTVDEARETEEENERPDVARRKVPPIEPDAPPLSVFREKTPEEKAAVAAVVADYMAGRK